MTIAEQIQETLKRSSWIRKMFEEGARLKAKYGAENVFDLSLGNPNVKPPEAFRSALDQIVGSSGPNDHVYMPNSGYPHVRKAIADYLSQEEQDTFTENEVIMTCGAAGALNVILKALLNPGDEVITPKPYFVEYDFYAQNHGGVLKTVPTHGDFTLDVDAISAAISPQTKAVLINSPNNPTGQVYAEETLKSLGACLKAKSSDLNHTIYLISDEPYRKIVFDGRKIPSIFGCYPDSIVATSYSKDLSVAGERIGFIAVNPAAEFKDTLINGMTLANRILGFVNAPALMQRVVAQIPAVTVDVGEYTRKRDILCDGLADCGYEFVKPAGALYVFPKAPITDDVKFVRALQKERVLVVPGSGFGGPGYFRAAFCVDDNTLTHSIPGFRRAIEKFR
jgi:aspartate aminotransferase